LEFQIFSTDIKICGLVICDQIQGVKRGLVDDFSISDSRWTTRPE
jgi:hypothetical protein